MSALKLDLERYEQQRRNIPLEVAKSSSSSSPQAFYSGSCSSSVDLSGVSTPLSDKSSQWELQRLLQVFPLHQSPKVTAFGMSPPVRNGRNGGAQNPLTSDPSWQTLAPTFARRNLQAIRLMERQSITTRDDMESLFQNYYVPLLQPPPTSLESNSKKQTKTTTMDRGNCPFVCEVKYFDPSTIHDDK